MLRRVYRFLRSRKLAMWLIGIVVVYSAFGTSVPQRSEPAVLATWTAAHPVLAVVFGALGLTSAWTSPIFIAVVTLFLLSTAACSWERTEYALKERARARDDVAAGADRLTRGGKLRVEVASPAGVVERVASELEESGLRTTTDDRFVSGRAGAWGLLGSPLFHWALVALMLLIAVGRLSRAEGLIGVPIGYPRQDTAENYGRLDSGPLYPGHSGLTISAEDFVGNYVDQGGQERGPSPVVTLADRGRVVARQRVYPNAPLRRGRLLIHMSDYGYAPVIQFVSATGSKSQIEPLIDRPSEKAVQSTPIAFEIPDESGRPIPAQAMLLIPPAGAKTSNDLLLVVRLGEGGAMVEKTLAVGQPVSVPGGGTMTLKEVTNYVRLSIADDWSVYPMYVLFGVAIIGLVLSLLVPFRTASVLLVDGETGPALHVTWRHRRGDPLFAEKVEAAVRRAAGRQPSDESSADRT